MAKVGEPQGIVHEINAVLQGAVVDVLAELVPEVRMLPRRSALESILDDVVLLERCFAAFRANPERFRHLLVDRKRVPVKTADDLLRCGRSLDEVVAMVVRTAAKRHFRRRLDGGSRPLLRQPTPRRMRTVPDSLLDRLLALLAAPKPARLSGKSRGRLLYEAFQDYLCHDWQVPLVPEYAALSPKVVRRLGARILDYHVAADIRRLKDDPDHPPVPTPGQPPPLFALPAIVKPGGVPAVVTGAPRGAATAPTRPGPVAISGERSADLPPLPAAHTASDGRARLEDILTADGRRLRTSAFSLALLDPAVRAVLPDPGAVVHLTQMLSTVGAPAATALVRTLGLRVDQLAVFLVSAHSILGDHRFDEVFGLPGRPDVVGKLLTRAQAAGVDHTTPVRLIAALSRTAFAAPETEGGGRA